MEHSNTACVNGSYVHAMADVKDKTFYHSSSSFSFAVCFFAVAWREKKTYVIMYTNRIPSHRTHITRPNIFRSLSLNLSLNHSHTHEIHSLKLYNSFLFPYHFHFCPDLIQPDCTGGLPLFLSLRTDRNAFCVILRSHRTLCVHNKHTTELVIRLHTKRNLRRNE